MRSARTEPFLCSGQWVEDYMCIILISPQSSSVLPGMLLCGGEAMCPRSQPRREGQDFDPGRLPPG